MCRVFCLTYLTFNVVFEKTKTIYMQIVNIVLRLATTALLLTVIYQLFISKKGSLKHILFGKWALFFEGVIAVTVTIRGMQQEVFTPVYILHLIVGGLFFLAISATGVTGFMSKKNTAVVYLHKFFAWVTFWVLLLTILLGIFSKILSQHLN